MRFNGEFIGSDPVGMYSEYICPHCSRPIGLLSEKLRQLQKSQGDPTIGCGRLAVLCLKCSHIGIARVAPVAQTLQGKVLEYQESLRVGYRRMRCDAETCKSHLLVVVVVSADMTDKEVSATFDSATIPAGFCCAEGHQIRGRKGES
jgi:hypothetical protein